MALSSTDWIAFYAAVVSTGVFAWEFLKWHSTKREVRRERSRIRAYPGIRVVKRNVPHFGDMHIFPLCVSNLGREPVIIQSVEMRYANGVFHPGAYNEPDAALGIQSKRLLPRRLEPGDTLELEQFTLAAFKNQPIAIVVIDSEGQEHSVPKELVDRQYQEAQRLLVAQS